MDHKIIIFLKWNYGVKLGTFTTTTKKQKLRKLFLHKKTLHILEI